MCTFTHVLKPEQFTKVTSSDVVTNSTPFTASRLILVNATEAVECMQWQRQLAILYSTKNRIKSRMITGFVYIHTHNSSLHLYIIQHNNYVVEITGYNCPRTCTQNEWYT